MLPFEDLCPREIWDVTASPRPGGSSAGAAREGAAGHSRGGNKWRPDITIGGTVLPWTDKFKYLGSHFTATGELDTELSYRIGCAAAVFRRLQRPFFCQRAISLGTRMVVFVVMVLSVLLYGCESWALTAAQLRRLEVFHKGCLRQILGVRRRDGLSDAELYVRCGRVTAGGLIPLECIQVHWHRRALRWLGHLGRMEHSRLAKQLLWGMLLEGVGRPGKRTNPLLPQFYQQLAHGIDPQGRARRAWQNTREAEGGSLRGFQWLVACKDKDTWRELVDRSLAA